MELITIVFGGVGLFLLGMTMMTEGLKAIAGNSLKHLLSKFTKGTFTSILSGVLITALIQSSSATSLMTVGFVSAGLLTFAQSVGVIIGANVGSTSTGWLVSLIGFKVSIGMLAFPLIGLGAFLRLMAKGRFAPHGMALAGLGMLFLGIDTLQKGMSSLTSVFSLQFLGSSSFGQIILLFVIGIVMTVVLQSSSTAFVITLSALVANTLTFEQAAAIVIGQNIGTTIKVYLIALSGTVPAKRTALAHVLFNFFTGLIALVLFPGLVSGVLYVGQLLHLKDLALLLSLYNSLLYLLGMIVLLPLLPYFNSLITRLAPDKSDDLVEHLDPTVATVPAVAIEAARRTLIDVTRLIAKTATCLFVHEKYSLDMQKKLDSASNALNETRHFLSLINNETILSTSREYRHQVDLVHIIDHLERLIKALTEEGNLLYFNEYLHIQEPLQRMERLFWQIEQELTYDELHNLHRVAQETSLEIAELRRKNRKDIFEKTVLTDLHPDAAIQEVHALHWVDRLAYHLWRSLHYIHACTLPENEWTDLAEELTKN